MNPYLVRLREQREALDQSILDMTQLAATEQRDLSAEELTTIEGIRGQIQGVEPQLALMTQQEQSRLDYLNDARRVDGLAHGLPPAVTRPGSALGDRDVESWGEQFVRAGVLTAYLEQGARGMSRSVDVGPAYEQRAAITSSDISYLVPRVFLPEPKAPPELPTMLALVPRRSTTSHVINFLSEESFDSKAALVAEAAEKPESALEFKENSVVLRTWAHWIRITRQALDDAAQMRSYIDGRLRYGLQRKIEGAVLNGETGATAGLIAGAQAVTGEDFFDAVVEAIMAVEGTGHEPTGVACNGRDWFGFLKWLATRPTGLGDTVMVDELPYRVMGLPIATTSGMPAGKVLVGDFREGCELWDREQTQVLITDSHSDYFIRNVTVILAEARLGLAIYAPHAFAVGTIEAPSPEEASRAARPAAASGK